MIRIRSDESLFIISRKLIDNYPNSKLSIILSSNEVDIEYIHKENRDDVTTLYVDADPNITKIIVRLLRGGKLMKDFEDIDFLKQTLEKFGLVELIPVVNSQTGGNTIDLEQKNATLQHIEKIANIFENHNAKKNESTDFTEFSFDVKANLESALSGNSKIISEEPPRVRKLKTKNINL